MHPTDPAIPRAPATGSGLPPLVALDGSLSLLRGLSLSVFGLILILTALWHAPLRWPGVPLLEAMRHGGFLPVIGSSLILAFTGLCATWIMLWARRRALRAPAAPRRRRWFRPALLPPPGNLPLIGLTARWPQAIAVSGLSAAAVAVAWLPSNAAVVPANVNFMLGGAAIVLAFPLLIAERFFAAMPPSRLREAASLRALLLLPVLVLPGAAILRIAAGLGVTLANNLAPLLAVPLTLVAMELALRALGRCFLPPPPAATADAAIESLIALVLADGVRSRGLAAPIRQHFGIDFSRSWALSFLRAAVPPVLLFLLLLSWGLSGLVLVGFDRRAVYERFGAPVAVLHPGLHAILPWPMGQVRWVEYGPVHEATLTEAEMGQPVTLTGAEDRPPPEADRLWEQAHPNEINFLIASASGGKESFQIVSADIKLRYRIAMTDEGAMRAAYLVTDPQALLRATAGRAVAAFLVSRTLDTVLGANREAMAAALHTSVQQQLDAIGCGIELAAVAIEAIHPPAGAAEAYHNVQAAQIMAETSVAGEREQAANSRAQASQYATEIVGLAISIAAETTGRAAADVIRFDAETAAITLDKPAFLLERRLTALAGSLSKGSLIILDHRIPKADAPVLDLRPVSQGAPATGVGAEKE